MTSDLFCNRPGFTPLRPWQAYAFAVVATALTLVVRLTQDSRLSGAPTLIVFTLPIILGAYFGGVRGGLLSTLLSSLAASYYLLPPLHSLRIASRVERWELTIVVVAGVVTSILIDGLHRSRTQVGLASDERRRGENPQAPSQEHSSALITWSPEAVTVHRDGQLIFANPAALAMFGAPGASDLIGTPLLARVHPDSHTAALQQMSDASDRRTGPSRVEIKALKLDGTVFHAEIQGTIIDYDGQPAVLASMRDISVRKEAELALRLERDRFHSLFEYAPVGILIADPSGRYLDANATICALTGYARDELVGRDATLIVTADEVRHIPSALELIKSTDDYRREWRFKRKDGTVFLAEVMSIMMPDGNLLAAIRDVTERHEAIEAIRVAEERMRFALESAKVGIWDIDYTTGVLQWSPTLEAQYGLVPGTFAGTFEAFAERIHPADRAAVTATVREAAKTGSDFTVHNRAIWPDGTIRFLTGAGRIILDERGKAVRGVGISIDVTEQRTLEAQFQQSQKMEAVGRLAGGVAHDFNNLLTVILGYTELLMVDLDADSPHRSDLATILAAGRSAAGLTRQLLAFSRQQIIEPTRLNLNDVVTETRAMLSRVIGEDVWIVVGLEPALASVMADRAQVEQVLMNLAVNARDAMPKGGTLTIETANVALDQEYTKTHLGVAPGQYVMMSVSDTGVGMTPEVRSRLFEPFFTTKDVGKGTGLGLATVHGIVARSGGTVNVYSEIGVGTTFKVFLPIAKPAEAEVAPPALAEPHPERKHTVLVVDDAQGLRELTRRLLERLGYKVEVAANAHEAQRAIERNASIDLLLTDVVMPGASGPELSKMLTALRPDLRVVYMSGYTDEAIVQHGVLNPGVTLLNKPFTSESLDRKLREVLDR